MKTIAVLEGWAGGPKLSRFFRNELVRAGFKVTKDVRSANIVFAHSTGCYMLPNKLRSDLIVLVDPPYWPGESIVKRWVNMNKNELKMLRELLGWRRFITDKLWEFYYIFAKPSYSFSVFRNQSHLEFLESFSEKQVILIRNSLDEFCSPQVEKVVPKHKNLKYLEVSGYHADYYINPKPYIDLLLKAL